MRSSGVAPVKDHPSSDKSDFAFTAPLGFEHPMARAHVKLLGPCFKTGRRDRRPTRDRDANRASKGTLYKRSLHYPSPTEPGTRGLKAEANKLHPRPRSAGNGSSRMAATKCRRRQSWQRDRVLADPTPPGRPAVTLNRHRRLRESLRLLLSGFTYSWTLSSKCFSTFPHGTCSLSVSGSYLALRGVYHALWAVLPNNSTLGKSQRSKPKVSRAYHPLRAVVPVKVYLNASAHCDEAFPNTTFHATEMAGGSVLGSTRFIRHY